MILVDSSVWVDYFNGVRNAQSDFLDRALPDTRIATGDIILHEVLRGFKNIVHFRHAKQLLFGLEYFDMLGRDLALESAENFRELRKNGVTVRKSIDVVIGTFAIRNRLILLHRDRDFEPLVKYLGLKVARVKN